MRDGYDSSPWLFGGLPCFSCGIRRQHGWQYTPDSEESCLRIPRRVSCTTVCCLGHTKADFLIPRDTANPTDVPNEHEAASGGQTAKIRVRRDVDARLDLYLQKRLKRVSRSKVQKLIAQGGVLVNGRAAKPSTAIQRGDVLDVTLPPAAVRHIEPEPIPLEVLYEDESYLVINKQAGLIVHPARNNLSGTMVNALAHRFRQHQEQTGHAYAPRQTRGFRATDQKKQASHPAPGHPGRPGDVAGLSRVGAKEFRPGIVHRLDRYTTGVIVVAKTDTAHWAIARQFEKRSTLKAYLAIVHGNMDAPGGVIDHPIGKHPTIREGLRGAARRQCQAVGDAFPGSRAVRRV